MSKAEARIEAQRSRVLAAAQCCFESSGFHNASIAAIAAKAGMSAGLIYRYFKNKNAIILAIIEDQLAIAQARIRELRIAEDLGDALLDYYDQQDCSQEPSISGTLFLEMSAEGTRDPEIAQAIQHFDTTLRAEFADWLSRSEQQGGYGLAPDVAAARAMGLQCFIDGLMVRKVREPAADRSLLQGMIRMFIGELVTRP